MEPDLASGPIACASLSEIDGQIETGTLIRTIVAKSVAQGLALRTECQLTGLRLEDAAEGGKVIKSIQTDLGDMACDVLVLAGGPDSPDMAALAGIELPLASTFGVNTITEPTGRIFHQAAAVHTAADLELQIGLRQWPNGSVMIHGGISSGTGSYGHTDAEIREIVRAAVGYVHALAEVPIQEVRRGRRPIPADGLPILGFTKAVSNLYLASMHSGVTLGALVGAFAPIEILDRARIDILAPYRLERFAESS